ncbi:MAG: hypothetical protein M1531_03040 [Chloroflexi bacterium]|nr:hypothetical protein [Chloroflexota bacterium]
MKERTGAKVKKTYDVARTLYQRLLEANVLTESQRTMLRQKYDRLNPMGLLAQIRQAQTALWKLSHQGILAQAPADAPIEEAVCE